TARLGSSRLAFEHTYILEQGYGYIIEAVAVDKPFATIRPDAGELLSSFQLVPPSGRVPGRFVGRKFLSPFYLFSVSYPNGEWVVPKSRQGVRTAIEFVKKDRAACALVRVEPVDKDFVDLKSYVENYVKNISRRLTDAKNITSSEGRLSGEPASRVRYESTAMDAAICTTTQWISLHEGRIYHLILITHFEKQEANAADLETIRKSFRFLPAEASPPAKTRN
ncbi:MAG: hypothetical protein QGD94_03730, partial [Planctomycetia bacterium]|nr:hypothetical protein [Planctomycetia bacterium]